MSEKQTDHGKLAEKIARLLAEDGEPNGPYVFDGSEVKTLQAVIAFVDRLRALKWFGKWAFYVVVGVGTIIVNWERIKIFVSGGPQ